MEDYIEDFEKVSEYIEKMPGSRVHFLAGKIAFTELKALPHWLQKLCENDFSEGPKEGVEPTFPGSQVPDPTD